MSGTILGTYSGAGRLYRILYVVISDEDYNAGHRPIPTGSEGRTLRYKKLSSLTDIQADSLRLSRALNDQRKRNNKQKKGT